MADPLASPHHHDMEASRKPLLDHLVELRRRLMWSMLAVAICTGCCWFYVQPIFHFLVRPLAANMGPNDIMQYTGLTESFFTYIKVAFFAGTFLSFPVIATQLWKFVAPGLYKNERHAFLPFLIATPILFVMGAAMDYFLVMPLAWKFFLSFRSTRDQTGLPVQFVPKMNEYLDIVMALMLAFGVCFEMPVLLTLLGRAGLITSKTLASKRKYAVVINFIVAAVLTPPDLFSMFSLAIPLLALYEISILSVRLVEKKARLESPRSL